MCVRVRLLKGNPATDRNKAHTGRGSATDGARCTGGIAVPFRPHFLGETRHPLLRVLYPLAHHYRVKSKQHHEFKENASNTTVTA
jgi:hypothetical protein